MIEELRRRLVNPLVASAATFESHGEGVSGAISKTGRSGR